MSEANASKMAYGNIKIAEIHGISYKTETNDYMKLYMKEYNKIKVECSCGKMISKTEINKHKNKSVFHKKYLATLT